MLTIIALGYGEPAPGAILVGTFCAVLEAAGLYGVISHRPVR